MTPQAEALMTADTPPDWAYSALRGADFFWSCTLHRRS